MRKVILLAVLMLAAGVGARAQGTPHANTVQWTAPPGTITGYNVYRSNVSGSGYVRQNAAPITALTYTDTNTAAAGTQHFYVVTALNGAAESPFSAQVAATDVGPNVVPPSGVTVTSN